MPDLFEDFDDDAVYIALFDARGTSIRAHSSFARNLPSGWYAIARP
jgi:hypothetical protein